MDLRRADRAWTGSGLLAAVLSVPVLHLSAVDLESRTADEAVYLEHVQDRYTSILFAGTAGLLVTVAVLVYVLGLRHLAAARHPVLADACTGVGALAVGGLALGFMGAVLAASAAEEGFPFAAVRPMGLLAESAPAVLLPALAGPALLVAVVALQDRVLPRSLGYASAVFVVLLTALAVLVPGAGMVPALIWLLVSSLWLVVAGHAARPS